MGISSAWFFSWEMITSIRKGEYVHILKFLNQDHPPYNWLSNIYWLIEHCSTRSLLLKAHQRPEAERRVTLILTILGRSCRVAGNHGSCERKRMWIGNMAAREQLTNREKNACLPSSGQEMARIWISTLNVETECWGKFWESVNWLNMTGVKNRKKKNFRFQDLGFMDIRYWHKIK